METAKEERAVTAFQAEAHTYFYTLLGGGSSSSRLDRWYMFSRHDNCIRDVSTFVTGPASDHKGISIRIGVPRHVVRVQKPRRVYPVVGFAHAAKQRDTLAAIAMVQIQDDAAISVPTSDCITTRSLAYWWDNWKTGLRKALLETNKTARQCLTKSDRHRLSHIYVRLDAALVVARTLDTSPSDDPDSCDQPSAPDSAELWRNVAECRRL